MYRAKLIIIGFVLILITFGVAVWANTTEMNLSRKIKLQQIGSFKECANKGFPVQESYPRKCVIPGGKSFTEILPEDKESASPEPNPTPIRDGGSGNDICIDKCGDGFCPDAVCLGSNCPCIETVESCPQDCK